MPGEHNVLQEIDVRDYRRPDHEIHPLILERWSPRAMTGESVSHQELMRLFEAARWAPSSYNAQPWRFLYARRETEHWPLFFHLLVDFNQRWAKNAAVLAVILSRMTFERSSKPSRTHSFDAGATWQNLVLQGLSQGLVVHGMEGFDHERARRALKVSEEFYVEAMVAIGRPAPRSTLPDKLRERKIPSGRKALLEIVFEGSYPG